MTKQKTVKDITEPKTKDEQIAFIHHYAVYFTERIWDILDEYEVSYNVADFDNIEESMVKMFNDMCVKFFAMFAGHLTSILAVKPHPEIHKDQNKILEEWFNKQTDLDIKLISESRAKKFYSIIKSKTEN